MNLKLSRLVCDSRSKDKTRELIILFKLLRHSVESTVEGMEIAVQVLVP